MDVSRGSHMIGSWVPQAASRVPSGDQSSAHTRCRPADQAVGVPPTAGMTRASESLLKSRSSTSSLM